ncbi:VWA domain-containing protein [Thiomicrorhabdus sp.]|uniref:vWA domain-containing protein n=1 Tax=Thiomicrorhabdus sp. TaxID=2039724 RepID=UPI0029C857FD|nr:VWA domain-containing protein [Thiomicrorhabdus sp.]
MTLLQNFSQFDLIWPWMLAFLPVPWIIRLLIKSVEKRQSPLLAPQIVARLEDDLKATQWVQPEVRSRRIPFLYALLWLLLIFAASRPVWYLQPAPFTFSGKELMLAVDLSGSMRKGDMYLNGQEVSRLVAVKAVVSRFIEQRKGDRMGLVVFADQAFLLSPLTYDLQTVKTLLNESEIGMAGTNTAIGDAIGLTLKHLQQAQRSHAVIILLTDGSNTGGIDPLEAAAKAEEMGVKIYTIGVGKTEDRHGLDRFLNQKPDIDIDSLQRIAERTGGQFYQANDSEQLGQIYQHINQLESSEHDVFSYHIRTELYVWPLGSALLLSMLLAALWLRRAEV